MENHPLQQPPGASTTTTATIASKKDMKQWIQMAKDSANNPKAERLEKSEDLLEDMYIVARSGSITWASFDYQAITK